MVSITIILQIPGKPTNQGMVDILLRISQTINFTMIGKINIWKGASDIQQICVLYVC